VAAAAAALLLVGFWTPIAGVLMAVAQMCLAFSHPNDPHFNDPGIHILLGALGASLAMLGPGAWSMDARRFGRKRIQIPQHKSKRTLEPCAGAGCTSKGVSDGKTI
jgi:putative oxidoreductase